MILGLIGAGIALCGVLLVMMLAKPKRAAGDLWIAAWLAAHLVHFAAMAISQSANGSLAFTVAIAGQIAVLFYAPTQYLAIWSAISVDLQRAYIRAGMAFAFILVLLFTILLADIRLESGALVVDGASVYLLVVPPVAIVMTLIYPAHALLRLHDYRVAMKQRLSNLHVSGLYWMKIWLTSTIVVLIIQLVVFLVSATMRIPVPIHVAFLIAAHIAQIAYVGYHGFVRSQVFRMTPWQANDVATKESVSAAHQDYLSLKTVFESDQLHLQSDLAAPGVADRMGWGPDRLTSALKLGGGTNFHDFVNRFRVETLKELALEPENSRVSLLNLALDAGFGSKSALYSAFRQFEGQTPARWRRGNSAASL